MVRVLSKSNAWLGPIRINTVVVNDKNLVNMSGPRLISNYLGLYSNVSVEIINIGTPVLKEILS